MKKTFKNPYLEPAAIVHTVSISGVIMANSFGINNLEEDNSYTGNPYYVL